MSTHHLFRTGTRLAPLALLSAGILGISTAAAGLTTGTLAQVPDHPFPGTSAACDNLIAQQISKGSHNYPDSEVEPYVVADPVNPSHLVAAYQQDRWDDGGDNGNVTVVSDDGGQHWQLASTQPAFTVCEGAAPGSSSFFNRASDPWVSYSSDGSTVYQASLAFNANGPAFGGASSVQVSTSGDGGKTWNTPVPVKVDQSTTVLNDKESVTADPNHAANAYVVWDRLVSPSVNANPGAFNVTPAFRGPAWFAKTTDGGKSWGTPHMIYDPGQKNQTIDNQIVVEPDGTLVDGFVQILTKGGKGQSREVDNVAVIRSTDGGATWSAPVIVSRMNVAEVSINGQGVRTGDIIPAFTADPATGHLYAVWQDGRFSSGGQSKIAFSMSADGGLHWSAPIRIDQSPGDVPAFTPQVHVSSDGTIGVSYYDLENATAAEPGLTDAFLVTCHPTASTTCGSASSWAAGGETRLSTSGSFNMTTAPNAGGFFVGDYEGLTSTGSTFDPFFMMAQPIATKGLTDPFANTAK
ncbi:MAG: exo-alpha-sialidase [Actinobacteria bacterium]|nr:exo-alpha-sialidase [Actinomycetota bacterium]MBO0788878.1 exo-alpha-sialidase [Actinomycetota bacterium]